jgi:hypothetical protein
MLSPLAARPPGPARPRPEAALPGEPRWALLLVVATVLAAFVLVLVWDVE